MSRYLDWRLDELYPEERGATTKRTGQASRKAVHEPGPVDKWWSGRDQRASEFRERGKASIAEMRQQWMGTREPLTAAWDFIKTDEIKGRGRQRREPFKPIPWIKHPANPYTQLSENQKHEINSKPINDFTNRNVDPGAWNVPKGLVERTMDWNLNPKWFSQEKGVVPSVLGGEEWISSPLNKILSTQGSKKGGDKSDSDETAEKWKGASEILKNVAKISSLWDEDESTWMGTGFSFMG